MHGFDDIIKIDRKFINQDLWKFSFRENGFVIIERLDCIGCKKEWRKYHHGKSLICCLKYIYDYYFGKCGVINYDDLRNFMSINSDLKDEVEI